ncbi:DUF4397 domain-containing protein [Niastella sp. OAS944]|uniref:DUF4397 domain-containing protein n=1 Tax=Niastella sp. OAS944 TaxID=2664089 RepID=UPI0034962F14|nr:hypothetical protein [Chitinophagaceae bacterium OAS944]
MKTVQVSKKAFLSLGTLAFLMVMLSGCLKNTESTTVSPRTYVSLLDLAPWSPSVDVYFDNSKATTTAIGFGMVSPNYSSIEPAAFGITFKKAGSDSLVASLPPALYDSLKYYTLLLYNTDQTHVAAARIKDDYTVLTSDKSFYRFYHMSPDVGDVDVYFDNNMVASSRSYVDNINLSDYYNQYVPVTPNSYTVTVKKAGTDVVVATSPSVVSFTSGDAITLYLKGVSGGTGTLAPSVGYLVAAAN